jgi:hypothetical protein
MKINSGVSDQNSRISHSSPICIIVYFYMISHMAYIKLETFNAKEHKNMA